MIVIPTAAGAACGALLASFSATCADRLGAGTSPWRGRSRCESCGRGIAPYDLLPLLSFAALRGACRRCGAAIPRHLVSVELLGAIVGGTLGAVGAGTLGAASTGAPWHARAAIAILATALASATLTDLRQGYVYGAALYPALALLLALAAAAGPANGVQAAAGAAVCAGALGLLVALTRGRGMGIGDAEVGAVIGAALGPYAGVQALGYAFLWGGAAAAVLLAAGRARRGQRVAFVPYLAAGTLTAVLLARGSPALPS